MPDLPADTLTLLALFLALGLRHGLDADHLAAVDALTRLHWPSGRRAGAACGLLFALGHGGVVLTVALASAQAQAAVAVPEWLDRAGAWVSVLLLLALGVANLRMLLARAGDGALPGWRSRWLIRGAPPAAAVGALFALSFDTLGIAALCGLAGRQAGGLPAVLACLVPFVAGMAIVDGLNGWWVHRLLAGRAHRDATLARWLGWAVVAVSLGTAAVGLVRLAGFSSRADDFGAAQGLMVLAVVGSSWAVAWIGARRRAAAASGAAAAA